MAAVPFAIRPGTLNLLVGIYKREGRLPSSSVDLYLKGCRLLCGEPREARRISGRSGDYSPEQRMMIAMRIAATTTLSKRHAIWTGQDLGDVRENDVKMSVLCVGEEKTGGNTFPMTDRAIRETLGTALFWSRGPNHKS